MINIDGSTIVDKKGRKLASIVGEGKEVEVHRLPASSIGDYFAVLTWLIDWGYEVK